MNEDYESILVQLDKHNRLEWFIKHYENIYENRDESTYYRLLRETLVLVDHHQPYLDNYQDMINIGNDPRLMMNEEERSMFERLPDPITVYRGVSANQDVTGEDIIRLIGNSWSLEREISVWFSVNHSKRFNKHKFPVILTYIVPKSEVISYFKDRNEEEIVLDHTNIDIEKILVEILPQNHKPKFRLNQEGT
jgi:hypothetical protein